MVNLGDMRKIHPIKMLERPKRIQTWKWDARPKTQFSCSLNEASAICRPLLSIKCRKDFLRECWGLDLESVGSERDMSIYESYFNHYEESCMYLPATLAGCTHEFFCQSTAKLLLGAREVCEAALKTGLSSTCSSPKAPRECIEFIGKAILMMDLSTWRHNEDLHNFITRSLASESTQIDQYRIPLSFNARTFVKVAGIQILWSRDLISHLEIGLNDNSLSLFHNVAMLQLLEESNFGALFPKDFFDETKRTMSLMLPVADSSAARWFTQEQQKLNLDPAAGICKHIRAPQRNIQDFKYWRDRLIIAKETFDASRPTGILQLWRDDRNPVQWWTFWVAIVVFLLTLIGAVEGALQVYKAYHPTQT